MRLMTMKNMGFAFALFYVLTICMDNTLYARSNSILWQDISERAIQKQGERQIIPQKYRSLHLSIDRMTDLLAQSPAEFANPNGLIVPIPMPDGETQHFQIWDSPVMPPELARQYPSIKTYTGQGVTDKTAIIKLDVTAKGFHAMILRAGKTIYIDPYQTLDTEHYISYYTNDYIVDKGFECHTDDDFIKSLSKNQIPYNDGNIDSQQSIVTLRTYQIAISTTGEYTAFHGGTVADALAAIATTLVRVNGVYERDIAVRFILIANNNLIVYTDAANDPYNDGNPNALINQVQATIDMEIGTGNYDIGHIFSTGGGGLAGPGPCWVGSESAGVTGIGNPVGDPYDIDYVAHEVGHQLTGSHTFNATTGSCGGNRDSGAAYEPGSGSTIVAYAGICGNTNNIQGNSDDHFHAKSLDEMIHYTRNSTGNNCPGLIATANNTPTADAGSDYTIPINTPFMLTSPNSSDPDGDAITYCWEQYNLGPAGSWNNPSGNAPIFRSYSPTTSPTRYCPALSGLASGNFATGEILPSYARTLTFRLTIRDNNASAGGIDEDDMEVDAVDMGGTFAVSSPSASGISWAEGSTQTISWSVGNTTNAPVSCANVDIMLSTDGGLSFTTTLLSNTPNDGSQSVTFPNGMYSTSARIMVKCSDNIFFDISDQNFGLTPDPSTITCTTYASTNIPITIDDDAPQGPDLVYPSTLNIPDNVSIYDINLLNLTGTHTWINDITFALSSPTGTMISLMNQICDDEDDFNLNFDDSGSTSTLPCPPTGGGTYQPAQALSNFNNECAMGDWTFTLTDTYPDLDGGSLDSWSLEICSVNSTPTAPVLQVKTFLQGAYSGGSMNTGLQSSGLLPTTQPFNASPWNYNGSENIANTSGLPNNIVDWVLIEARDANNNDSILEQRATLLLSDGSVIDTDGSVGVTFNTLAANQNYYVSVKHRNHVGLLSTNTVTIPNTTPVDFTVIANVMDGADQLQNLGGGNYGMAAGDLDGNGTITVADFNAFLSQSSTINTYANEDSNLDGNVTVVDYNLYLTNSSLIGVTQVRY